MHTDLCQPHPATLTPLQTPSLQRRAPDHRHRLHLFLPAPVWTQDATHIGGRGPGLWDLILLLRLLSLSLALSLVSPSVLPASLSSPSLSSKQAPARAPGQLFLSAGEEESEALPLFLALVQPCCRDRGKDTLCVLSPPSPFFLYKLWKHLSLSPTRTQSHVAPPFLCLHPPHCCSLFHTPKLWFPTLFFLESVDHPHYIPLFPGLTRDPWLNARQGFAFFISLSPSPFIFLFFPVHKKTKNVSPVPSLPVPSCFYPSTLVASLLHIQLPLCSHPHTHLSSSAASCSQIQAPAPQLRQHMVGIVNNQEKPNSDGSC